MLLFLDLDNTLVDRDGAFERWAERFVREIGGAAADSAWIMAADRSGYTPRRELAQDLITRFVPNVDADELVDRLREEVLDGLACYPGVVDRLQQLSESGARLVIVTNGESRQQRRKLAQTGLDGLVDDVVISAEVGVKKPDGRIFAAARATAPADPDVWMIGDHVRADMEGGRAAGASTGWVSHGRPWTEEWWPTLVADTPEALLARVLRAQPPKS